MDRNTDRRLTCIAVARIVTPILTIAVGASGHSAAAGLEGDDDVVTTENGFLAGMNSATPEHSNAATSGEGSAGSPGEATSSESTDFMCTVAAIGDSVDPRLACPEVFEADEPAAPVVTNAAVLQAFREVPLPEAVLTIQPPGGETLVNFATNFYTVAEPFTTTVVLLGYDVEMSIHPASFRWTFGDGSVEETTTPGAAYPDLEVTHAYTRTGEVTAEVVTTWAADFRVDGGAWQTVAGTVAMTSTGTALTIREATPVLVD